MRFTTLIGTARTDLSAAGGRRPGEGPVPDVLPEGSGQRPRRSGSLAAIRAATAPGWA